MGEKCCAKRRCRINAAARYTVMCIKLDTEQYTLSWTVKHIFARSNKENVNLSMSSPGDSASFQVHLKFVWVTLGTFCRKFQSHIHTYILMRVAAVCFVILL